MALGRHSASWSSDQGMRLASLGGVETEAVRAKLTERYRSVRATTERICAPLSAEDQGLQSMPDCSPSKWHRAHTTWFFETFVLMPRGAPAYDPRWGYLFNSYYESLGPRHLRPKRGLLSRPSAEEVSAYRRAVDEEVVTLLSAADASALCELVPLVELGNAHEEQHQELILTDILNAFSTHPLGPRYRTGVVWDERPSRSSTPLFSRYEGGLMTLGAGPEPGFSFDNEAPRHRAWVEPFELSQRLVTVAEWKAFRADGGYQNPALWLSEGFEWVQTNAIAAPLYAAWKDGSLWVFGLDGAREACDAEPIVHVSYYEADAIARFLGARLPTEAEWELAAKELPVAGTFLEEDALRALPAADDPSATPGKPRQMFGDAWEWTASSYSPYPGYAPRAGALGEYNGKFMVNQMVLRGGSCFTPRAHMRATYRNFWPSHTRFQMTGIRLARKPT
jgi:ergothioneine biosynthesis protein EgtB